MADADLLLSRVRALAGADPARGMFFYPSYDAEPSFFPFAALPGMVAAYMDHYRAQGVGAGCRVIVPFETSEPLIFSFLALLALGALPLSVRPRTLGTPLDAYGAFLSSLALRHGPVRLLDAPSLGRLDVPIERIALPAEGLRAEAGSALPDQPAESVAFVQFSSGSVSEPKGVPITHGMLALNLRMITDNDRRTTADVGSTWLPLYHDMGLIGGLLSVLYVHHDAHVAAPSAFLMSPLGWLRHLSDRGTTLTVVPNFAINYTTRMLRDADPDDLRGIRLDPMRCVYLGSEPIHIDNLRTFSERLAPHGLRASCIKPCYGMAESVLLVTCVGGDERYRVVDRPGGGQAISVGRPHAGYDLRVRTEAGALCADREVGEIEIRGGSLADRYFEHDRSLRGEGGFYATGDLGFVDAGELFISGRIGDRMKINAQSYFAGDFEQALEGLPFTRPGGVAVIQAGERVVVLIEVTVREARKLGHAHRKLVGEVLLRSLGVKVPAEDVLFVRPRQIERTSSGKIRRHAVLQAYTEGRIRLAEAGDDGAAGVA